MSEDLPDVQVTKPDIEIPIKQVGVENIEVPFKLQSKQGGFHETIANVAIRTTLDAKTKGISMSRLLLTLKPYLDLPLKSALIEKILAELFENVVEVNDVNDFHGTYITFDFKIPVMRKSIKTDHEFPLYYKCRFEGHFEYPECSKEAKFRFFQGVTVQYASYCPCSAELCNVLEEGGHPHNQRSFAHIMIETEVGTDNYIWLEDVINQVESCIPTLPYPIIKRPDEQEIGRVAKQNPMFVEDAIRAISQQLINMNGVIDWIVKCSHEESIHASEAIAINWRGVEGGLNGRRYL